MYCTAFITSLCLEWRLSDLYYYVFLFCFLSSLMSCINYVIKKKICWLRKFDVEGDFNLTTQNEKPRCFHELL